jgi:hypothetical protein
MNQIDYAAMSAQELRQYWLTHKEDKQALDAYLARRSSSTRCNTFHPDDADFETRMMALVQRQVQPSGNPSKIN